MSLRAVIVAAVACSPHAAAADRAIAVEVGPAVPFDRGELADALRVRLDPAGAPVAVRVTADADGVVVDTGRGEHRIALGGTTGADAARLVALVAVGIVDDTASAPALAPAVAPALAPSRLALRAPLRAAASPPTERSPTVGVVASVASWSGAMAGAALALAFPRDTFVVRIDAGAAKLVGGSLDLSTAFVRFGAGIRRGSVELGAAALIAPIDVGYGTGDRTILFGATGTARLRLAFARDGAVVFAAGADAFATRTEYRMATGTIATPWVAPWLGLGLEVTP